MNANELRKKFLGEHASFVLEEYNRVMRGDGEFSTKFVSILHEQWELCKTLITKAKDIEELQASNSSEVILLIKEGKITVSQAKDLMDVLRLQKDVEAEVDSTNRPAPVINFYNRSKDSHECKEQGSSRGEGSSEVASE